MFNEALQDLKDRFPARLSLVHLLSRQHQEMEVLNGRIDEAKVTELLRTMLPPEDHRRSLPLWPGRHDRRSAAGPAWPPGFLSSASTPNASSGHPGAAPRQVAVRPLTPEDESLDPQRTHRLKVMMDGKTHQLAMAADVTRVLDVALQAGLDLPDSCRGGVCCTCRAKVLEGTVKMEKSFTLEPWEIEKGFVLTCQALPLSETVVVSYDDR